MQPLRTTVMQVLEVKPHLPCNLVTPLPGVYTPETRRQTCRPPCVQPGTHQTQTRSSQMPPAHMSIHTKTKTQQERGRGADTHRRKGAATHRRRGVATHKRRGVATHRRRGVDTHGRRGVGTQKEGELIHTGERVLIHTRGGC